MAHIHLNFFFIIIVRGKTEKFMLSSFKDFGVVTYLYNPDFSLHQFNFRMA